MMDSITIHGLPRVFSSRSWISKVFWSVAFITSCSFLSYLLYDSVKTYQKKKFLVRTERKRESKMYFPSMNICDTDISVDADSMDLKEFPKNCTGHSRNGTKKLTKLFLDGCKLFMNNLSFSCEYNEGSKCNFPKHFTPANNFYQCYTFNEDGSLIQKGKKRKYGVNFLLFKNSTKTGYGHRPLQDLLNGLFIQVNPQGEHLGYSSEKAIYLVPGFRTEISLKKKVLRRLQKPFQSQCSSKESIKQIIGGIYTEENCQDSCRLSKLYEECGFVDIDARPFMPEQDYPTTNKDMNETTLQECKDQAFDCDCPLPCHKIVYQTTVVQKPWRQAALTATVRTEVAGFMQLPLDEVNLEFFTKNMIHLSVYYEDFTTETMIEEELYSKWKLLSEFGGLMGLLIGASTISLLEVIWLLIETVISKFSKVSPNAVAAKSSGQESA